MTSVIWKIAGAAWGSTALTAALMQARWYVILALTVAAAVLAAACVAIWFWAYPRVTMHRTVSDTKAAIARRRLWADSGFEPDDDLGRYAGGGAAAKTSPEASSPRRFSDRRRHDARPIYREAHGHAGDGALLAGRDVEHTRGVLSARR